MFYMKLTQQDMARILDIDARTLRNWRKNKPKLYDIVMKGFAVDKAIDESKKNYENLRDMVGTKNSWFLSIDIVNIIWYNLYVTKWSP